MAATQDNLMAAGILPGDGPLRVDRAGNLVQAGAPTAFTPSGLGEMLQGLGLVSSVSARGSAPANPAGPIDTVMNKLSH